MATPPTSQSQTEADNDAQSFLIGAAVGIVALTVALVVAAVLLAINARSAGPGVEIVRDLLIVTLVLELLVIGAAVVIFIIQVARFVNLLTNEIEPIITSTQDTVNVVRGTAVFISKNAVEPIIATASAMRGIGRVLGDIDAIGKAAGIGAAAAAAMSATGARSAPQPAPNAASEEEQPPESADQQQDSDGKPDNLRADKPSFTGFI